MRPRAKEIRFHEMPHQETSEITAADREAFMEKRDELIARAKEARDQSVQWRNFEVGCSMLGKDARGTYHIFTGSTHKYDQDRPKRCAERTALQLASDSGMVQIVGIVVVSREVDTNPNIRHEHTTLYPCLGCRMMLRAEPLISPDTLLITINDRGTIHESTDLREFNHVSDVLKLDDDQVRQPDSAPQGASEKK